MLDDRGVRALGKLSDADKRQELARADVLCAPSLHGESFGMVITEGLAAGTPVLASDIPGYRDVLGDGLDGQLVPVGDPLALAEALRALALDPARRRRMAVRRSRARRAFRVAAHRRRSARLLRAGARRRRTGDTACPRRRAPWLHAGGSPAAGAAAAPALDARSRGDPGLIRRAHPRTPPPGRPTCRAGRDIARRPGAGLARAGTRRGHQGRRLAARLQAGPARRRARIDVRRHVHARHRLARDPRSRPDRRGAPNGETPCRARSSAF